MSSLVECTECRRTLRVPPELIGREVRCPSCRALFVGAASAAAPPTTDDDRPWDRDDVRRDWEPHRGTLILVLSIISIVLVTTFYFSFIAVPLGVAAWWMGYRDLTKMRAGAMDPTGEGTTRAGYVCGIVSTILGSLCSVAAAGVIALMIFSVAMTGARPMPLPPPPQIQTAPVPPQMPDVPEPDR